MARFYQKTHKPPFVMGIVSQSIALFFSALLILVIILAWAGTSLIGNILGQGSAIASALSVVFGILLFFIVIFVALQIIVIIFGAKANSKKTLSHVVAFGVLNIILGIFYFILSIIFLVTSIGSWAGILFGVLYLILFGLSLGGGIWVLAVPAKKPPEKVTTQSNQ